MIYNKYSVLNSSQMANPIRSESRIEAIQSIYQLGYMLEEIRVTYKKDSKMSVDNLVIDAKEGDMSSLPRWIAKILVQQDAVEIQSSDITGYISRTMNRERIAKPHDLSGVDVDFYVRVNDHLEGLKERERENLVVSLNTFVASRLEKIVKLAAASSLSPELESKLAAEEKELYIMINNASTKFKKGVLKKFV
jgi:DNA replication factor GINS